MTTAKLIINGKEIEVQLTEEQAQELTAQKKVTGFERVDDCTLYYCINEIGQRCNCTECHDDEDKTYYESANYYSDMTLAEWCSRNDTLNRKMRRWAAEHNAAPIDWENSESKWYIYYNCKYEDIEIGENKEYCSAERVYFQDYSTAKAAIEEFGDEIEWLAENRPKWF